MRAILIRHGETPGNAKHRYVGRTDEPLSAAGRAQAERAGVDPSLPLVFVSPMLRARETAAILFPRAEQRILPDLREMDFGVFEGRSAAEMEHDPYYRSWVDSMCLEPCPGGESKAIFQRRATAAFTAAVCSAVDRAPADDVVFVVHGGVIMSVLEALALPKRDYYSYYAPNLGGYSAECVWEAGALSLRDAHPFDPGAAGKELRSY